MRKRLWIWMAAAAVLLAGLLAYGILRGDVGYVFRNASNTCFS